MWRSDLILFGGEQISYPLTVPKNENGERIEPRSAIRSTQSVLETETMRDAATGHASLLEFICLLLFGFPLAGHLPREVEITVELAVFDHRGHYDCAIRCFKAEAQLVRAERTLAQWRCALGRIR